MPAISNALLVILSCVLAFGLLHQQDELRETRNALTEAMTIAADADMWANELQLCAEELEEADSMLLSMMQGLRGEESL